MNKRVIFLHIVFALNLLAAIGLIAALLAPEIDPKTFWPLAIFGLAFPIVYVANFVFIPFWALFRDKRVFLSLFLFLIGIPAGLKFFQFQFKHELKGNRSDYLNVISFNTHFMGGYDKPEQDTVQFFKQLEEIDPDIICFQEFANLGGNFERPMFREFFRRYRNFSIVNATGLSQDNPNGYGVCIFSKHPIVNKGFVEMVNKAANLTIFADVVFQGETLRVVNTHLKSIVFEKQDYKTVETISKAGAGGVPVFGIRRIIAKLKYAFKIRCVQADAIREKLDYCIYPIILCGDFNDSPTSYSYKTIRGDMKDAFVESGSGFSTTYTGNMPSFRIDQILHDARFSSENYQTHVQEFSDHAMISCSIKIK
ncbi:MAG: endonuclease/exonuclease/phosphatase family protein [Bacteroidia bacterium]